MTRDIAFLLAVSAMVTFLNRPISVRSLDNGLALTPPMGWLSWLRFGCQTDCKGHPLTCISEHLLLDMADRMVNEGYKDAGYQYVNVDDCWLANDRDKDGKLQPDPSRFPHGIKWLTDQIHSLGLKFGIYEDYGTKTCAGFPGSLNNIEKDAQTFADWGVDYLKFDACNCDHDTIDTGYPQMSVALNKTGRPIVYSCEWAFYTQFYQQKNPNYTTQREYCNVWRVHDDIGQDWSSIDSTIRYFDSHQDELIKANGPGGWNDPDMLSVGNPGLTVDQARAQFGFWSLWSVPLLMSNDLRFISQAFKDILLNKKVIAVNQDPLGFMARLVVNTTNVAVYVKPMTPLKKSSNETSYAIGMYNRNLKDKADIAILSLKKIGLSNQDGYNVEDLYSNHNYGLLHPDDSFSATLNPTSLLLLKATAV